MLPVDENGYKPDEDNTAMKKLSEGRIILMIENSNEVIILPCLFLDFFKNPEDYDSLSENDELELNDIYAGMDKGEIIMKNLTNNKEYVLTCSFTDRQKAILKAGSLLAYTKEIGE